MKRTILLILTAAVCLSLFACGSVDKKPHANVTKVTEVPAAYVSPTSEPAPTDEPKPTEEPTPTPVPKYGKVNLALDKPVEADAVEKEYEPEYAVDGDYFTRWSCFGEKTDQDNHFLKIDLGQSYKIGYVAVTWESCEASFLLELLDDNGERVGFKFCDAANPDDMYTETFFDGITARYVVIYVSKSVFASPYEIEVFEQLKEEEKEENTAVNLALKGTASAPCHEKELVPENANDGDYMTRWAPGGPQFDEDVTWTLDLGEVKSIEDIIIYFESNQAEYRIEIAMEETGTWETVYEWQDTDVNGKNTIHLGGKEARFVRYFRPAGCHGWCSFYEFEIIGK